MSFLDKIIALGGASGIGGGWLWSQRIGGEIVAVVMVMLGVGLFAALAWRAELWEPREVVGHPGVQKTAGIAVSLVIVSSAMLSGPVVGTASAAEIGVDCTLGDFAVSAITGISPATTCSLYANDDSAADHAEAYKEGEVIVENQEIFLQSQKNVIDERRGAAWSEAKITLVNELNNNSTQQQASDAANATVDRYFRTVAIQSMANWDAAMIAAEDEWRQNSSRVKASGSGVELKGFVTYQLEFGNHSNGTPRLVSYRAPVVYNSAYDQYQFVIPGQAYNFLPGFSGNLNESRASDAYIPEINNNSSKIAGYQNGLHLVYTAPPGSSKDALTITDGNSASGYYIEDFYRSWDAARTNIKKQMATYSQEVYNAHNSGDLNGSDILNPTDLASRASTNYETTGSNSFASAGLANLGLSGDMNHSVTVTHEDSGNTTTRNGTLFYTGEDVSSFDVGQTYDLSNLNGTFYISVQNSSNDSAIYSYSAGNVTIEEAQNPDTGDSVQSVNMESYHENTTNATTLKQELEDIRDLQKQYDERYANAFEQPSVVVNSDGSNPFSIPEGIVPALAVGGAVIFLLNRS